MRLVYTIPDYWPYVRRGSERLLHDLSCAMVARGHDVTIVTRTPQGDPRSERVDGVRVDYRRPSRRLARALRLTDLESFAATAASAGIRHGADVYHAFYLSDAWALSAVSAARRRPLVVSFNGMPHREHWERHHPRTHRWFVSTLRRAAAVAVLSEDSAARFRADYDVEPVVLTPGIRVSDWEVERVASPRRSIVCAAAVDDPRKRIDVLVRAFALIAADEPDVDLLLVGPGRETALDALRATLPDAVAARVLHRHVPTAELPRVYASATVGALTSEKEAFGLVVAEYLAGGLPSVASDDAGSAEIVSADTGVVFRRGDDEDCARALRTALAMAADPCSADRCRARARTFDWSVRAAPYEALYRRVAATA